LLRPEAVDALRGSDLIIHAGDVGKPEILERLRELAPVVAVRGNVDTGAWVAKLRRSEVVQADGANLYVLHNLEELDLDASAAGFQIVVSGHTHQHGESRSGEVLFVNPGSAGPKRFDLPVTLAKLDLAKVPWKVEFVELVKAAK